MEMLNFNRMCLYLLLSLPLVAVFLITLNIFIYIHHQSDCNRKCSLFVQRMVNTWPLGGSVVLVMASESCLGSFFIES